MFGRSHQPEKQRWSWQKRRFTKDYENAKNALAFPVWCTKLLCVTLLSAESVQDAQSSQCLNQHLILANKNDPE